MMDCLLSGLAYKIEPFFFVSLSVNAATQKSLIHGPILQAKEIDSFPINFKENKDRALLILLYA